MIVDPREEGEDAAGRYPHCTRTRRYSVGSARRWPGENAGPARASWRNWPKKWEAVVVRPPQASEGSPSLRDGLLSSSVAVGNALCGVPSATRNATQGVP